MPDGFTQDQFQIDWAAQCATCTKGQRSERWTSTIDADGGTTVSIEFAKAVCQACDSAAALHEKHSEQGRSLRVGPNYALMQAAGEHQQTAAFRLKYALRAGIEGTISAVVRHHGARRTRYSGQRQNAHPSLLTAIAINLRRTALWLMGERPGTTRPASLACLAPAQFAA